MAAIARFWRRVRERTTCICGNGDLRLHRSHHERQENFWCPECGGEGTYYRTGKTSVDRTAGDIRTDGIEDQAHMRAGMSPLRRRKYRVAQRARSAFGGGRRKTKPNCLL